MKSNKMIFIVLGIILTLMLLISGYYEIAVVIWSIFVVYFVFIKRIINMGLNKTVKSISNVKVESINNLDGVILKCTKCGASIDANKGKCEYCNTEINYLQEWILVNKK